MFGHFNPMIGKCSWWQRNEVVLSSFLYLCVFRDNSEGWRALANTPYSSVCREKMLVSNCYNWTLLSKALLENNWRIFVHVASNA